MSFLLSLVLIAVAGLVVLVAAASASFPNPSLTDLEAPEGEWVGPARLPPSRTGPLQHAVRPGDRSAKPVLKVHSWT